MNDNRETDRKQVLERFSVLHIMDPRQSTLQTKKPLPYYMHAESPLAIVLPPFNWVKDQADLVNPLEYSLNFRST